MLILLLGLLLSGIDVLRGFSRIEQLSNLTPLDGPAPPVSLIVAGRNEERNVESAMRSLLAQAYPALEIIAVDDRSTDRTGAILDSLSEGESRLRTVHIRELPPGWLGKNHALAMGAASAQGKWLLFADADVVMTPDTVSRAVGFAERGGLDHLTILPDAVMPGLMLKAFVGVGMVIFGIALRPWKARDPRSRSYVGVGAFNLVRKTAYVAAGGHDTIRLRPDDDLKLAKILKRSGARQDVLSGRGMVSVEWYHSIGETIDGLMKNSFSVMEYRALPMLAGSVFYVVLALAAPAALILGSGTLRVLGGLTLAVQLVVHLFVTWKGGLPWASGLLYPVAYLLFAWIVLRATVLNLSQGGIFWRGTFYSLKELRKNRV